MIEYLIQYGSIFIAVAILFLTRKGMKKYVPVALFASLYANLWCYIAIYFNLWHYNHQWKLFSLVDDISIVVNMIVVPIMAMIWVRYCPLRFREQLWWAFIWTTVLMLVELPIERFTRLLDYRNGYRWYHSYILWFASWFIWLVFYLWFNDWKRDMDSLFT
ncbi:Competence protein [Halobacteroides halobius DSM 5150]|uniref:Competence protein n=1 Tax=Halobacteroides halobius (strain ATCC 35273 / DSM 5150 / MD-1) TaxID=748449 RepID=L0KCC1_HALHC|nr:CBO0543 family protein [Halobacteroides halobius]AGB42024.1 Competence protein [Halobacteroides halobius DSM 5150]